MKFRVNFCRVALFISLSFSLIISVIVIERNYNKLYFSLKYEITNEISETMDQSLYSCYVRILKLLYKEGITTVILDPDILKHIHTIDHKLNNLPKVKTLTIGMEAHLLENIRLMQPVIKEVFGSDNLNVQIHEDFMPVMKSFEKGSYTTKKVTHFTVRKSGMDNILVDIVVMYHMNNFLYTGKMSNLHNQNSLTFKNARAFTIFDLQEIEIAEVKAFLPKDIEKFLYEYSQSEFIPCNYTRQKEYLINNPSLSKTLLSVKQYQHLQILVEMEGLLRQMKKRHWISDGTLLGWYRECRIIPYTYDVDVQMLNTDVTYADFSILKKVNLYNNTRLSSLHGKLDEWCQLTYGNQATIDCDECTVNSLTDSAVMLDLYFMKKQANKPIMITCGTSPDGKLRRTTTYPLVDRICSSEMHGYLIQVPCSAKLVIEHTYGNAWMMPKNKNYSSNKGENAVLQTNKDPEFRQYYRKYGDI